MTLDSFIVCLAAAIALAAFELWRSVPARRRTRLRGTRLVTTHMKSK